VLQESGNADEHLLTVAEVQRWLKTSRAWVYAAVRDRRIPYVRLGGEDGPIRFLESDVREHIRAGRVDALPTSSRTSAEKTARRP
jgi:excisionase family DNA binding protein